MSCGSLQVEAPRLCGLFVHATFILCRISLSCAPQSPPLPMLSPCLLHTYMWYPLNSKVFDVAAAGPLPVHFSSLILAVPHSPPVSCTSPIAPLAFSTCSLFFPVWALCLCVSLSKENPFFSSNPSYFCSSSALSTSFLWKTFPDSLKLKLLPLTTPQLSVHVLVIQGRWLSHRSVINCACDSLTKELFEAMFTPVSPWGGGDKARVIE